MRCEFIGEDGSLGYHRGQVYDLEVRTDLTGKRPHIERPRPCPYGSWDAFWRNWRRVQ